MIIGTYMTLIPGRVYRNLEMTDGSGNPHQVTFMCIRVVTKDEYLQWCKDNNATEAEYLDNLKNAENPKAKFYHVHTD